MIKKFSSSRKTTTEFQGEVNEWYVIYKLVESGNYEQASELLFKSQQANSQAEFARLKSLTTAAYQICLICDQIKSESEAHRSSYQVMLKMEHDLQQQLCEIVKRIMEFDLLQERGIDNTSIIDCRIDNQSHRYQTALLKTSTSISQRLYHFLERILPLKPIKNLGRFSTKVVNQSGDEDSQKASDRFEIDNLPMGRSSKDAGSDRCMSHLVGYFFGTFQVFQNEKQIIDWDSLKAKAILKYLLVHRNNPVFKDILMDVFWPDATPEAARRNLHQAIYSLRQTLRGKQPDFQHIRFENDCYFFNPELEIWLDFDMFDIQIRAARQFEAAGHLSEAIENYIIAESYYLGDFLEEDLYEDWPRAKRAELQTLYLDVTTRLVKYHIQVCEYSAAIALCRKIIAYDNCSEAAYRQLIRCYLAQGQRHLALREYHRCMSIWKEELALSPSEEFIELYRQIIA